MRNLKKIFSLILCVAFVFSLAACKKTTTGGSDYEWTTSEYFVYDDVDNTDDGTNTDQAQGNTSTGKSKDNSSTVAPGVGSGNRVKPSGSGATIDTKTFQGKHLKLMLDFDKSDTSDIVKGYFNGLDAWCKKYTSTYEIILKNGQSYNSLQSAIAAGDPPDIFYQVGTYPSIISAGCVQPIEEYIPANQKYLSQQSLDQATWVGHIYSLFVSEGAGCSYIGFNPDLFAGHKTPAQYFNEGNWTWDTFRTVAKEMTGNGVYGVYTRNFAFFGSKYLVNIAKDGKLSSALNSSYTRAYLDWYYKLYNEDKVFTTNSTDTYAMWIATRDAEPIYDANGRPNKYKQKNTYCEIVPFPAQPGTNEYVSHSYQYSFMVPVGVKNPAMSVSAALSMCSGWASYVNSYDKAYSDYERRVRAAVVGTATPILDYPGVQVQMPQDPVWNTNQFTSLIVDKPATAIASLDKVLEEQCKAYNMKYVK